MRIHWFGHSAFQLVTEQGTVILIDPYGRFLGYRMPSIRADIVAVTHNHKDHSQIHVAEGSYELIDTPGHFHVKGIEIEGISTYHDNVQGAKKGTNTVFVFTVDGLRICHAGDLGHTLSKEQLEQIGKIDVLMIPVGGRVTLDGAGAAAVMKQLQPAIAIPMHYRTKALGVAGLFFFAGVSSFLKTAGQPVRAVDDLVITRETLDGRQGVYTLQY
ncbi:MBL fold metallo-hydrolase [Paenibacillus sp. FSL K6-1096]|uniref:MBL fold metallo-hydrolase n=1 Tax=Paenibacillus sp. FSL K6-1096 TaxID=2921460 RepID=UPI0030ECDEDF